MKQIPEALQTSLGNVKDVWLFAAMAVYYMGTTLLRPTPWLPGAPGLPFELSLVIAALPLAVGLIRNTPAAITTGLVMAAIGPYNQTAVILAFFLGVYLGVLTLWNYRGRYGELFKRVFVVKGFYYLLTVVAYIVLVWQVRLGDSTDWWSFLALASSLLTVPFAVYSLAYLTWDKDEILRALRNLFLLGLALATVAIAYPLITGQYEQYTQALFVVFKSLRVVVTPPFDMPWVDPDFNRVSFSSSHYFAAWMLIFAFGCVVAVMLSKKRRALIAAAILGLYCFALGENAHILPGAVGGAAAVVFVAVFKRLSIAVRSAAVTGAVLAGIAAVIGLLYFNGGIYSLSEKAAMYRTAGDRLAINTGRYILGDGPAAYASRSANKRLNHAGIQIEYSFPFAIPDFAQPAFKNAIVEAKKEEGGSTMKRTLSGVIGIVMEWGLLGTVLLLLVFYKLLKTSVAVLARGSFMEARVAGAAAIFGFLLLSVSLTVRTYFEYAELTSLVAVLFMLSAVSLHVESRTSQTSRMEENRVE